MATSTTSLGGRIVRSIRNFIIFFLFIGLAGAAVYAVSMLNARTYWLEYKDGSIVVAKGKMWPQGRAPYTPTDMALAQTYAPIPVKGQTVALPEEGFTEREALDRTLFDILANLAQRGISGDDAEQLALSETYVQRTERLANLSTEQLARRTRMRTELAFFTARRRIDEARLALEAARADLKTAADVDARHRDRANELLLAIDPQLKLLIEALRATSTIASSPTGETNVAPQIRDALGAVMDAKDGGEADAGAAKDGAAAKDAAGKDTEAKEAGPKEAQPAGKDAAPPKVITKTTPPKPAVPNAAAQPAAPKPAPAKPAAPKPAAPAQ